MGTAMMANLNQSKNLAPFCGYSNCVLASKPLNIFYDGVFYICGQYVKILESVQMDKTIYTLYVRNFDGGSNEYIDLYLQGKLYLALYTKHNNAPRRISKFVVNLVNYINNIIGKVGCFAEHIKDIYKYWLSEGYYFHKSIFKFILTIYKSKYMAWIPPYTALYNYGSYTYDF
jgi:hypothetical protein